VRRRGHDDGGMPEPSASSEPVVYPLRVVLRGVSPLIWRRLLVRSDSTIADLHATLQIALGWSDEHLNRFISHGREYGVSHLGGFGFRDDPRHRQVKAHHEGAPGGGMMRPDPSGIHGLASSA